MGRRQQLLSEVQIKDISWSLSIPCLDFRPVHKMANYPEKMFLTQHLKISMFLISYIDILNCHLSFQYFWEYYNLICQEHCYSKMFGTYFFQTFGYQFTDAVFQTSIRLASGVILDMNFALLQISDSFLYNLIFFYLLCQIA